MIHAADRPRTSTTQLGLVVLAVLALTFSFFRLAEPVRASHVDGATVQLHQDLGDGVSGENPGEFAGTEDECAGVEEGTTVFHFVANGLADGTVADESELHATFEGMGEIVVNGYYPNGESQPTVHFEIVIEGDATLTDAYAIFNVDQTEDAKLVLSHICGGGEGEVSEDLTLVKQDAEGGLLASVGFTLGDGDEMLTDESGQIVFTALGEGEWTLTETTAPAGCEAGGTLTVSIDAEGNVTVTDDDETDSLAIVSFDAESNVLTLSNDCETAGGQGMLEVEKFWCPTEGETRTEIDIFGPADPQARTMTEGEGEHPGCSIGADVAFTVYAADGVTEVTTFTTDENGIAEIWLDAGDYVLCEDMSGECAAFTIADGAVTAAVVVNYVAEEEQPGTLEVEKFFCPTDGETRTEFDVFGPADPQMDALGATEGEMDGCTVGADVSFTLWSIGEEAVLVDDNLVTDENGIIEIELAPGSYRLCENMSEECVDFEIGSGQVTAIVVVNYVAQPQGQIKVLKYFCDAETDSVEFYLEGQAPNLENCEPGDASFTLDDGEPFSTEGGIAVIWADEGSHTLAEVGTEASVDLEVVEGEITTVIVLNNQAAEEVPQGQVKVLKYACEADEDGVEFVLEGDAPADLESCDPADAEFTLDGGAAFSTSGGIAIVWADEGSHTLAEVGTDASVDIDVVEGAITTVIVLNNVATDTQGGGGTNNGGNGGTDNGVEGGVQGGQGGPGAGLPDTATGDTTGFPVGVLALLMLAGLGGFGAVNLQSVRRRIG